MPVTIELKGIRELKRALSQFPRSTSRAIQTRVLLKAAQPIVETAKSLAPRRTGRLAHSIIATTKRPTGRKALATQKFGEARGMGKSLASARGAAKKAGPSLIEVFIGPGRVRQAWQQEFGNVNMAPHPYMRPAWDMHKAALAQTIETELWAEIKKAAARSARGAGKRGR